MDLCIYKQLQHRTYGVMETFLYAFEYNTIQLKRKSTKIKIDNITGFELYTNDKHALIRNIVICVHKVK